uniref:Uncharacterized protein n=1 Tax=Salix viminalis TaxID=40686 RepID=A0A6N2KFE9_SALVM
MSPPPESNSPPLPPPLLPPKPPQPPFPLPPQSMPGPLARGDGRGVARDGADIEAASLVIWKFVYALVVHWAVLECGVNIMVVIAGAVVRAVRERWEQGSKNWCRRAPQHHC